MDKIGIQIAKVIDTEDPLKNCRVKVSIPNMFEEPADNCPWVRCLTTKASSAGFYDVDIPVKGTYCLVYFINDDINTGFIIGYIPVPGQELLTNYPNCNGSITRNGNLFINDSNTGTTTFQHHSGTKIDFTSDGNINLTIKNNLNISVNGIKIDGNSLTALLKSLVVNSDSANIVTNNIAISGQNINMEGGNITIKGNTITETGNSITVAGNTYNSSGAGTVHGMTISAFTCPEGKWTAFAGTAAPSGSGSGGSPKAPQQPVIIDIAARARPDGEGNENAN